MDVDRTDLAVFAALLVAAFAAYVLFSNPAQPAPQAVSVASVHPCASLNDSTAQLQCFAENTDASDLSACDAAFEPDACAGRVAYDASDLSACLQRADAEACRYYYYLNRLQDPAANVSRGSAIGDCLTLTSSQWRIHCLQRHAIALSDDSICNAIQIEPLRIECVNLVHPS